jgi:putative ABC transport system permease protein
MNFLSELREGLQISWGAIRANKLRSVLTTLGIVIGIVTVTLMGTAIEGLNRAFVNSISFIGADVLYVNRMAWLPGSQHAYLEMQRRRYISLEQVGELQRQLTLASAVAPVALDRETIHYGKRNARGATIIGSTDQYLQTSGVGLAEGRFFAESDTAGGRPLCVIGAGVATNFFETTSALGQRIKIDQREFEVIGVLEKLGTFMGDSLDNQVIIPLTQFNAAFLDRPDYQIQIKAANIADVENVREEVRGALRRIRHVAPSDPDDFAINQQDQILAMFYRVAGTIAGVGLFITGLSLFVGGIGIMNIMFVSVAERTREIGIRKAIGAKRRTILLQFLIEAASICFLGGAIGVGIAWPMTAVVQRFLPAVMSLPIVFIALLVSLVTGVVSGFLPAWRAARMNPVDALRNE